ncbi:GlxA family transcriptional regulator [Telmatospirillum sp.]|uniref:GlxA family transcriptional regulator n=1 Tax=Telmatospirillum sp. TaxID=2079197 RepID=UPI00283E49C4|nr:GlxA family transcriptional regulator [Telmatospirillum sp.]MDR3436983.1 GlxA family transcriptional regulator [Telmatospirillum sp.]
MPVPPATSEPSQRPRTLAFVLIPEFSLVTFACAIEAFRMANDRSDGPLFTWKLLGIQKKEVQANCGLRFTADDVIGTEDHWDIVFIVSSLTSVNFDDPKLSAWLRRMARDGVAIAPLGAATVLAARLGLLDDHQCVTHWRLYGDFLERFPRVHLGRGLYCVDRKRLTCAGGFAAMDLGLTIVSSIVDAPLAAELAEISMISRIRGPTENQRMSIQWRYGVNDKRIALAIELMEKYIEEPLTLGDIAERTGVSIRQMERLFERYLGKSPQRHYVETRLHHGHQLLTDTNESILTVALKCGFSDAAHFTRQFKALFASTPAATRTLWRARFTLPFHEDDPDI